MKPETRKRLTLLKTADDDFEWYPTTNEMIRAVHERTEEISSVLDIGAGDGRVLLQLETMQQRNIDKYAIEIAQTHIENMPADINIVGTDFWRQTLIDKRVDAIFCNPPYSQYEDWAVQVIKEANASKVFLVLPDRWANSKLIKRAIEQRKAKSQVIWSGDFSNADRQARANVNIVQINLTYSSDYYNNQKVNPFDVWFAEHFSGFDRLNHIDNDAQELPKPVHNLVKGQSLAECLTSLYDDAMKILAENYVKLSQLDAQLLKEIGVSVEEIKKALKMKIEGLKNKYWQELFDRLDKITSRLTKKSRDSMLEKLHKSCNVDFTYDNIYAIVMWVLKNANIYFEQQLIEVFKKLSEPECVKNYKSNLKTWERDQWRYKKEHTRYMLEYRIVSSQWKAIFSEDSYDRYNSANGLYNDCHAFINDIFTIANNLGFETTVNSRSRTWFAGREQEFYWGLHAKTLVKIRAYKNGNLHLKFDQDFIRTLNIEASRLLGWINSPQEAAYEMNLDIEYVKSRFNTNKLFGLAEGRKLLMAG